MGYVDLHRRVERAKQKRESARGSRRGIDPYLSAAVGFVLGVLASTVLLAGDDGHASLLAYAAPIPLLLAVVLWLRGSTGEARPGFGREKQLLLAIQDAGGSVTPVEAALLTSLTVDEAEEILTRFANRGHLLVEGRDGMLSYALPGGRRAASGRSRY